MTGRSRREALALGAGLAAGAAIAGAWSLGRAASNGQPPPQDVPGLPVLGRAAEIALTDERGAPFRLSDQRGRVVVVNFMFTQCFDFCPILTSKLVAVQDALGPVFGRAVRFASVTVDPVTDAPEVLRDFALALGYDPAGWSFLTGETEAVRRVAAAYGVVMAKDAGGLLSHNLLSTVVDRAGWRRVQYLGERFDPAALLADVRSLATPDAVTG